MINYSHFPSPNHSKSSIFFPFLFVRPYPPEIFYAVFKHVSQKRMYLCRVLRISTHIESILLVNDCVIIPDFGGFVLQNHPAVYVAGEHTLYPPHKEIVFNPALKHNDGLLSESYMQTFGLTFKDAQQALKKDIEELKTELEKRKTLSLGSTGSFRKGAEGELLFQPVANKSPFGVSFYGLATVHFSPLQTAPAGKPAKTTKPGRVIYLPVHRMVIRAAGMTAAAVALFLLISTPVKDVNKAAYTAGFILPEMILQQPAPEEQPPCSTPLPEETGTTETAPAVTETAPQPQPTPAARQKTYYIIIGSFHSEKQAEKFMAETNTSGCRETGTVKQDEKVRVYAARYENRKEAETYLHLLRENEKFKNAWLFINK
jgi:hypothetical protein